MKSLLGIDYFANPEALLLLLLIPVYLFWYMRFYRKQRLVIRLSYDPVQLQKPKFNLAFLRILPRTLQVLGISFLIIAIARPQTATEVVENRVEGIDIMLLLDTSGSMETEDFLPNRLEVAKSTAIEFIEARQEDRMGIVLFAENALSYAPLTLDVDFLTRMVRSISFNLLPRQGTAIGSAIAVGINRMRDSGSSSKVMILLTDGANNRGQIDPITAAKLASTYGVKIYAIGIGKETYIQPGTNRKVVSDLDENTLIRMAELTGGQFFRVTSTYRLEEVFNAISKMEKNQLNTLSYRRVEDHYPLFVKIAIVLLVFAFALMLTFMYNPLEQ